MNRITNNPIEEVFQLYKDYGHHDYIGEPVSQTEHMVLTAMLAEEEGCDDECILAALFHDVGHLVGMKNKMPQMDVWGTTDHDKIGAYYLKELGFSDKICKLVQNHVLAKRYLVTTNKKYYDNLSTASKETFVHQDGLMNDKELKEFEEDPLKDDYIKFRRWASCSSLKNSRLCTFPLQRYKDLCYKVRTK